jgi:NADPH-ferrihemoprotein reductase
MEQIENAFAIFVMATYGEGDPTDNAREFHEWLEQDQEGLECLKYTVGRLLQKTIGQILSSQTI